uniref:two-component regulator propeller domain-containing protein n=1 Tax=uncultured Bacteroides sp. TaxID=162156 RepID=UPI0025E8B5E2
NIYFPLESNIVNAIFQDDTGLTWIGTKSGLFSYDGYQIYKLAKETDIEYANITAIVQISKEYLCIGTNRGLRFFNLLTEQFENLYPATQVVKSVRSLAVWHDKLWIGTNDEGLLYYDFQNGSILHLPLESGKSKSIVYAFAPANGKLYIGSYDGLSCYDPTKQVRKTVSLP